MMLPKREVIYQKYGGRCAYCGCVLDKKNWHIDHLEPLRRGDGDQYKHRDVITNMMPSCPSCNHYKSTWTIEEFRREIQLMPSRINKKNPTYKMAKRYGLIREEVNKVEFYFEYYNSCPPLVKAYINDTVLEHLKEHGARL